MSQTGVILTISDLVVLVTDGVEGRILDASRGRSSAKCRGFLHGSSWIAGSLMEEDKQECN